MRIYPDELINKSNSENYNFEKLTILNHSSISVYEKLLLIKEIISTKVPVHPDKNYLGCVSILIKYVEGAYSS